ncbi:hypothetical protein AVEN_240893-1 [Araneus ventricosus]|uniref:Uncharacterized protein n=1 Tax=Araneus ventricosus TaxID=182803 RepID=A0A4Y2R0N4_ARAVE|nr:hypothetical protein AVEN_240893-1 [Araneus ventricosus]
MTRTTSELAPPPPPNFSSTSTGGCLATTHDLTCSRPHAWRICSGIVFRTWNPLDPKLRPYPLPQGKGVSDGTLEGRKKRIAFEIAISFSLFSIYSAITVCCIKGVEKAVSDNDFFD